MEQRPEIGLQTHPVSEGRDHSARTAQLSIEPIHPRGECFHWLPHIKVWHYKEPHISTPAKLSALFVGKLQGTAVSESHQISGAGKAARIIVLS